MNLFELLSELIPAWLVRRVLAFVLGFCLMGMVASCQEITGLHLTLVGF